MPVAPNNALDPARLDPAPLDPAPLEDGSDIFFDAACGPAFCEPVCNGRGEVVKVLAYTQVEEYFATRRWVFNEERVSGTLKPGVALYGVGYHALYGDTDGGCGVDDADINN